MTQNEISAMCREILLALGIDPIGHDQSIYEFASIFQGTTLLSNEIRREYAGRLGMKLPPRKLIPVVTVIRGYVKGFREESELLVTAQNRLAFEAEQLVNELGNPTLHLELIDLNKMYESIKDAIAKFNFKIDSPSLLAGHIAHQLIPSGEGDN